MKALYSLTFFLALSLSSFSQNYLSPGAQHLTEFSWSFAKGLNSNAWANHVQMGYTHAGRFEVSLGYRAEGGYYGDIIEEDRHFLFSRMSFAVIKEGIDPGSFSLAGIADLRLGGTSSRTSSRFSPGLGVYKRLELARNISIHPSLEVIFDFGLGQMGRENGPPHIQTGADIIFGKFKLSSRIIKNESGFMGSLGIGALIPPASP
ncbi:MAG: hypothetical protein AAF696_29770 [Bacteroidota bacterium]